MGDESEAVTKVVPAAETPRRRRRPFRALLIGLGAIVLLLLAAVAIFAAVFSVHLGRGVGERVYSPASVQELGTRAIGSASGACSST